MKWSKKILGILVLFLFLGSTTIYVKANDPLEIDLDAYVAEDGLLKLYINHNKGEGFKISPSDAKVVFGNNEMVTEGVSFFQEESVPISYKCVVDVSGSMNQERIDQAKEIIKDLARLKRPEDNIAITALGNELIQSEYMTDPLEIASKADILKLTREDTNLYYALVQELKGLQTEPEVGRKRCLIIFSDGADDQATGITREEAEKAVTDSHIPIFTVGLLKNKENQQAKEMAKILGSFARISSGGKHFVPALGEGSVEDIADSIVNQLNHSLILKESLEDVKVEGKEVLLKVEVTTESGETATDSMNVPESDIKIIREEQERVFGTPETEVVVEVVEPEPEEGNKMMQIFQKYGIYIIIAGILLVIFIVIVIILIVNKNKANEVEEVVEEPSDDSPTLGGFPNEGLTMAPTDMSVTRAIDSGKKYTISLIQLGKSPEKKYNIDLDDKATLGRNSAKNTLGIPTDTALSEVHVSFFAEKGRIYVRDEKSTNGTFINGVPISGKFELNQDDIMLAGSYEYRIRWK